MIDLLLLYLAVRFGAFLAVYTNVKLYQLCFLCVAIKFVFVSYGIQR